MDVKMHSIFSHSYHSGSDFHDFSIDTNELIFFINGEGDTTINGKTYHYTQNDICFTKAKDIKDNFCIKKSDYICIRFYSNMENSPLESGIFPCPDKDILHLFVEIQKEYKQKKFDYFEVCNLKIRELIIKISRFLMINISNENIYRLIQRIDRDKVFNITISEMAEEVSYSYDRFRHIFKEITGKSPTDYIINKRVEYACELLKDDSYSCTEISQLCGFATSAQFSAIFKKKTGNSPKNYRK